MPEPCPSPPAPEDRTPSAAAVAGVYAGFAGLWILGSDTLLAALVSDPAWLTRLSLVKGWAFVGVTAALLYVLLRRRRLQVQAGTSPPTRSQRWQVAVLAAGHPHRRATEWRPRPAAWGARFRARRFVARGWGPRARTSARRLRVEGGRPAGRRATARAGAAPPWPAGWPRPAR